MSENVKNSNQRLKILYLYKVLLEQTDKQHPISMPKIIEQLEQYGIAAERRAIYGDIDALRSFGLDIVSVKGRKCGYYVKGRDFELPELKLLADAVSSSRFLTEKKSASLIRKIETLASVYEAKQIHRQVYVANRVKSMNESIYSNVDIINRAIDEKKQISFKYFDYDIHKKKKYRDDVRTCHPYAFAWEDEFYYLVAYYDKRAKIVNFRVDKMEAVKILNAPVKPKPKDFNIAEELNSTFSMFGEETQSVKLCIDNSLVNVVIDRFGKDVTIRPEDGGHFSVRVNVKPTQTFFAWLFQFTDKVEIIEPREVKENYIKHLKQVLAANK